MGLVLSAVAALLTAHAIHRMTEKKSLLPPGFLVKSPESQSFSRNTILRYGAATAFLGGVLWVGVFYPLTQVGIEAQVDFSRLVTFDLFVLHGLLAICLGFWYVAGFGGIRLAESDREAAPITVQYGLRTNQFAKELGIGVLFGLGAWVLVVSILLGLGAMLWMLVGPDAIPEKPPELMVWLAALPISVRVALSLSAGFFEEIFFRGFLQPRIGLLFSTLLFVAAHASYAQPMMLVGVTLLSLVFANLVRWRQSIWSAVAAHAIFDLIQLLIVIPAALKYSDFGRGSHSLVLAVG